MIRPTHNPHTSFEGKFLLIPSQKHKKTRLIPKPSCYELRIYTPQEILSPREFSAEVAAYFLGKNLDTSLSKNNRQKSWPINFTFSHVQEKTITRWQWIFQISQMRFFWGPPLRHSPLCTNKITHTHTHTHTHKYHKIFSESTKYSCEWTHPHFEKFLGFKSLIYRVLWNNTKGWFGTQPSLSDSGKTLRMLVMLSPFSKQSLKYYILKWLRWLFYEKVVV